MSSSSADIQRIADAIRTRQRFVLSSHSRPDGDSIGSQMAMAYALQAMGKHVRVVNKDPALPPIMAFPGVPEIEIADRVTGEYDAAIIMECGDLARTGVEGLERFFVINIDHHPGNSGYGQINWFDASAAACGEMVFDLVKALGVPLTAELATHVYLAILTDTGSFHYSSITPRTFDICREVLEAGVDPVLVARNVYDSNNMGRLKLFGAVLSAMQIDQSGRIAIVYLDHEMARAAGGTYEDTEGLINLPLTVKEILAVIFFKQVEGKEYRVSMRSKGDIDIGALAKEFGGGGHRNAAGCTVQGSIDTLQKQFLELIEERSMDGLLVVNKPAGPTSHDVVARVRRVLRERRIGHTGTLNPMATGVLPLVIGRATRLARFLSSANKTYEARVRLGFATDSGDAAGRPLGAPFPGPLPTARAVEDALDAFRGTFAQQPPAFSAKKIAGTRSYELARQAARASLVEDRPRLPGLAAPFAPDAAALAVEPGGGPLPAAVDVTAHAIDVVSCSGDTVLLRVDCTAGFYIRSLAHDLGVRLGVGAHLAALCRTRTGDLTLEDAIALETLEAGEAGAARARSALVPLARMLPAWPACPLTVEGLRRAACGRDLGPADFSGGLAAIAGHRSGDGRHFRLLGPDGALVAVAEDAAVPGLLHPVVVLM